MSSLKTCFESKVGFGRFGEGRVSYVHANSCGTDLMFPDVL